MTQTPKVSLRGLYKIFGSDDKAVLQHAKAGMSKEKPSGLPSTRSGLERY